MSILYSVHVYFEVNVDNYVKARREEEKKLPSAKRSKSAVTGGFSSCEHSARFQAESLQI